MPAARFLTRARLELVPDGDRFVVIEPLKFYSALYRGIFVVQPGLITDFNSVPRLFWSAIPKHGKASAAGILHDAAYQGELRTITGDRQHCTREVADKLFLEALKACGVSKVVRGLMYAAVRAQGGNDYLKGQAAR